MNGSPVVPVARLHEAFDGHRCVSAWLGYGEVLFLGLGEDVLPPRGEDGRRLRPPFELETNFADWYVDGPMSTVSADSNRSQLEAAAESFVGEKVVSWELIDRKGLRVTFTAAKTLTVVPWDVAEGLSDAWCVKSPDGRILVVATDGRVVVVDAALPIRDWFGPVA
jgi:hypothetical protein